MVSRLQRKEDLSILPAVIWKNTSKPEFAREIEGWS